MLFIFVPFYLLFASWSLLNAYKLCSLGLLKASLVVPWLMTLGPVRQGVISPIPKLISGELCAREVRFGDVHRHHF